MVGPKLADPVQNHFVVRACACVSRDAALRAAAMCRSAAWPTIRRAARP